MDIYIYSDESGVFDNKNNEYYVYGGVVFLSKKERDIEILKYKKLEEQIKTSTKETGELKASKLKGKHKYKIMKATNNVLKFGVIINQNKIHERIYADKKDKQRYLDYAYKIGLKSYFKKLISENKINEYEVKNIYIFVDEHTTATNGKYEFREGLIQEFKRGTFNSSYDIFFEPIFKNLKTLDVKHCKSEKVPMIRLADMTSNYIYTILVKNLDIESLKEKIHIKFLP